jgi:replicative DNA helicase
MADEAASIKLPPHSVEAEQALLGGLMADNRALQRVQGIVRAADFYLRDHADIFGAIVQLVEASHPADVITVFERLQQRGRTDAVGLAYLNQLVEGVPSAANAAGYASIVAQASRRRSLMQIGQDLVAKASGMGAQAVELPLVLAWLQDAVAQVAAGQEAGVPRLMGELLPGWIDDLTARAEGRTDAISTGLRSVDRVLCGGFRRGELVVLGARPSMGKSAWTLGVVRAVAKHHPVLVCSLEDSANMLLSRHVASVGRTPLEHVRMPQHAPQSLWDAVAAAAEELQRLPVWVDDRAGLSLGDVASKVAYVKAKSKGSDCALVVVDYLQLMEDVGETRSNELAGIVRGLKNMAKRMDCAVLLLSQLSREADKLAGPPRLDHLAESGAIEQAADIIGLLWREARRTPKPDNAHRAQVEWAKNKNGATDTVQLWFDGRTQRFADMAEGEE